MADVKSVELAVKGSSFSANPTMTRKTLKAILASRNAQEEGTKIRKSVGTMAEIGGLNGLMNGLGCDRADDMKGIRANTVDTRVQKYGKNELEDVPLPTYLELCWEALQDPIMLMLLVSALVQFILACIPATRDPCHKDVIAWYEPAVILASVAIVVNVGAGTDYVKGKQLREMKEERKRMNKMNVYREGKLVALEVSDIVVGDMCDLTVGDIIPADGHFIDGNDMEVDESPLTGEPIPIKKSANHDDDHKNPWMIKGTKVVKGNCTFVAMAVGQHTTVGKINMQVLGLKVEGDDEDGSGDDGAGDNEGADGGDEGGSPLQKKLEKMAFDITKLGFAAAIFGAIIAAILWLILKFGEGSVLAIVDTSSHRRMLGSTGVHPATCADFKMHGIVKQAASFFANKNCKDMTMMEQDVKYNFMCNMKEFNDNTLNITTAYDTYPFKVKTAPADPNVPEVGSGDDPPFCQVFDPAEDPLKIVQLFVTAVTILVVAIPEGLPLAVNLALAVAQAKLSELNNMVKVLESCETMGSATTICSDKTGTLTKNRMTVTNVFFGHSSSDGGYYKRNGPVSAGDNVKANTNKEFQIQVRDAIAINTSNTSLLVPRKNKDGSIDERQAPEQVGNKTECGFLGLCVDLCEDGVTYETIRKDPNFAADVSPAPYGRNNACKFPFSSERKRMSWIVPTNGDNDGADGGYRLHCKGASEVVLARCTKILLSDSNAAVDMTPEYRQRVLDHIKMFANEANRTLVMAFRDFPVGYDDWEKVYGDSKVDANTIDYDAEHDLTFLGLVGIEDPLRDDVPDAIVTCATAGVDVRMVTGDNIRTAIAIASNCGILREEHFMHLTKLRKLDAGRFGPYAERLDNNYEATLKLHAEMRKNGFTEKEIEDFKKDSKAARGRVLKDGTETTDPVQCVRDNFAMEGGQFAQSVTVGNVIHMGVDGKAPEMSYGKPVDNEKDRNQAGLVVNQEALDNIWPRLRVMARCQPEDKLTLVQGLMESTLYANAEVLKELKDKENITIYPDAQIVAVTGDGTNDAPALKRANVGFAMGITGTQVAQDACDIILMDDNFSSIIVAILYGRNVYESVQKFIQFQLTVNIVAVVLAIVGAIFFQASPLGAVQMLWVNLIMDSLASLALATEEPEDRLLEKPPIGRNDAIITSQMYFNMFAQAAYQFVVSCVILFRGHLIFYDANAANPASETPSAPMLLKQNTLFEGLTEAQIKGGQLRIGWFAGCAPSQHYTMLFNAFVMMTLFNQFSSRKLHGELNFFTGLLANKPFIVLSVVELGLQALFVQALGAPVGCVPGGLTGGQWGWCLLFGLIGWGYQLAINMAFDVLFPEDETDDVKVGVVRDQHFSQREIQAHKEADRLARSLSTAQGKTSFEK